MHTLVTSLSARPSPSHRRVGVHVFTFEACSSFTHVTACRVARPPYAGFVTSSSQPVSQLRCSLATKPNQLLSGRVLPPLVICAVGAHCEMSCSLIPQHEKGSRICEAGFSVIRGRWIEERELRSGETGCGPRGARPFWPPPDSVLSVA